MTAFVLMTALPPTTGHLQLAKFASSLNRGGKVKVIVCTQPSEPLAKERFEAVKNDLKLYESIEVLNFHEEVDQDPLADRFWLDWKRRMIRFGVRMESDDVIVASEEYGSILADLLKIKFFPYDIDRHMNPAQGRKVRQDPLAHWDEISPSFKKALAYGANKRITIFGAESTGKTDLAKALAASYKAPYVMEYARPYLEWAGPEINQRSMSDIAYGQYALQEGAEWNSHSPFIIQDTDLFSTVGFIEFYNSTKEYSNRIGIPYEVNPVHYGKARVSDLYLITRSNIPFEADQLRYGIDKRETEDQFWIDLCEKYHLAYHVIQGSSREMRLAEAREQCEQVFYDEERYNYPRNRYQLLRKYKRVANGE